jgi:hypothetical protein
MGGFIAPVVEYVRTIWSNPSRIGYFLQRSVFGDKEGIPVFDLSDDDNEEEDDLVIMRKQFASRAEATRLKVRFFFICGIMLMSISVCICRHTASQS